MNNQNLTNLTISELCGIYVSQPKADTLSVMNNRPSLGLSFKLYGKSKYIQNGKEYISDNKNVLFIPKGASYFAKTISDSKCVVINFNSFNADFGNDIIQISISGENIEQLCRLLNDLSVAYDESFGHYRYMSILYQIFELIFCQNAKSDSSGFGLVLKYIDENIGKSNITNAELAELVGFSEVYFRKLFKKRFGTSPIQYVINRRVCYSKQLLNGKYRIAEVAEKAGFNSIYHFSREFKKQTGKSPSEFAKQNACF